MKQVLSGGFAGWRWYLRPPTTLRLIDWNIEQGLQLPKIIDFLASQNADILTLQEVDLNARRTGCRNIAEEIARQLKLEYAFGREFQELSQGSRASPAYTGQATLSRWPLVKSRVIRFSSQSRFWLPRWYKVNLPLFQERMGERIALVNEIDAGGRPLLVFNVHLESRGDDDLRLAQLREILAEAAKYPASMAALIAGDMNLDVSCKGADMVIRPAGFREIASLPRAATTVRKGFSPGRRIDSILIRDGFASRDGRIHNRVVASDHFPLSCTVSVIGPS